MTCVWSIGREINHVFSPAPYVVVFDGKEDVVCVQYKRNRFGVNYAYIGSFVDLNGAWIGDAPYSIQWVATCGNVKHVEYRARDGNTHTCAVYDSGAADVNPASPTSLGVVRQIPYIPHVARAPSAKDFNALLDALRTAGIMAEEQKGT